MDRKKLRQYMSNIAEVKLLTQRIERLRKEIREMETDGRIESDVVACGKKGKKALGTVRVTGFPERDYQKKKTALQNSILRDEYLKAVVQEQVDDVDEYIHNIDDSEIRQILTWKYMDPNGVLSWQQVANRMNNCTRSKMYTADSCRMIIKRFTTKNK